MNNCKIIIFFLFSIYCIPSLATTWVEIEVDDPIKKGSVCEVHEPASFGTYIYQWPSKYDQVFWPLIDRNGIWYCRESGFTAFIGDFEDLSYEEKEAISKYLIEKKNIGDDIKSKLILLEDIYSLRNIGEEFKNKLLRVLARWYQDIGELEKANEYRKKALNWIKKKLGSELTENQQLGYLYLAANYSRLFGAVDESDQYITQFMTVAKNLKDKELEGFSEYLSELINETKYIEPKGKLDPQKKPENDL